MDSPMTGDGNDTKGPEFEQTRTLLKDRTDGNYEQKVTSQDAKLEEALERQRKEARDAQRIAERIALRHH
jgi:hypothetical protein